MHAKREETEAERQTAIGLSGAESAETPGSPSLFTPTMVCRRNTSGLYSYQMTLAASRLYCLHSPVHPGPKGRDLVTGAATARSSVKARWSLARANEGLVGLCCEDDSTLTSSQCTPAFALPRTSPRINCASC